MTVTPEQLAAFADGELDELTAARIRREIDADPALADRLRQIEAVRSALAARFDPILAQPVPARLTQPIADAGKVIDIGTARAARQSLWQRREFRFGAGAAIAASLVVAVLIGGRGAPAGYADAQLAAALDDTLSGQTAADGTRMLLSFRDASGHACRGYSAAQASGIACRDDRGWKVQVLGGAAARQSADYRQAGSGDAAVMAAAQDMAAGPALDAAGEEAARKAGWIPQK